jgi:hypothetical protein
VQQSCRKFLTIPQAGKQLFGKKTVHSFLKSRAGLCFMKLPNKNLQHKFRLNDIHTCSMQTRPRAIPEGKLPRRMKEIGKTLLGGGERDEEGEVEGEGEEKRRRTR